MSNPDSEKIEQLWEASHEVFEGCALPNGAIIAANSDLAAYPPEAENYRFSWPRDAAYQLYAAHIMKSPGIADRRSKYIDWLLERAEGFSETGLLVKRYGTNGVLDLRYGGPEHYQPDQAGALLWSLSETQTDPDPQADKAMRKLANGLTDSWQGTHFNRSTQDLWENRLTNPADGDVFVYSLAACTYGLRKAVDQFRGTTYETDKWAKTVEEMEAVLRVENDKPYYTRKIYADGRDDPDNTLDASLSSLVYPFSDPTDRADPTWQKRANTVLEISKQLYESPDGVLRYPGDTYDGIVRPDASELQAGRWPLLTFGEAAALDCIGKPVDGREMYDTMIARLDALHKLRNESRSDDATDKLTKNLIPEQIYADPSLNGRGVEPLAWSYAAFVMTTVKLGIIKP